MTLDMKTAQLPGAQTTSTYCTYLAEPFFACLFVCFLKLMSMILAMCLPGPSGLFAFTPSCKVATHQRI